MQVIAQGLKSAFPASRPARQDRQGKRGVKNGWCVEGGWVWHRHPISFRRGFFRRGLDAKGPEFCRAFAGAIAGGHSHSDVIGTVAVSGDLLIVDDQLERITRECD